MNYNDNKIIAEDSSRLFCTTHANNERAKSQDLIDLFEQMKQQREYMNSNNFDHSLDNLIETTDKHLDSLRSIIKSCNIDSSIYTTATQPYALPHYRPFINQPEPSNNSTQQPALPNTNNNIPNINNGETSNNNLPNTNNNIPNINNESTPPNNNRNRRTRNSPLQSGYLSNIIKSFFGKRIKNVMIYDDQYRNRFHNTFVQSSPCNYRKKLVTNECNILRLLLLYITLHPHCRHICQLSELAEERVGILSSLI